MMASEGQERDPRALPLAAAPASYSGARRRGRPLGGGSGPSETRERAAVPWQAEGSAPQPIYSAEQQAKIADLFQRALDGALAPTRPRALKVNEPEKLNERHLAMISMRATGLHQRLIAKAFGDNDLYVHQILNHPDAQYLLSQLLAMRALSSNLYQERMEALAEPAMSAIEDALLEDDPETIKIALKKAPLAFRVLEQGGKIRKPEARGKVEHTHRLEASPEQMRGLRDALLEARELRDVRYSVVEVQGESEDGEVREMPSAAVGRATPHLEEDPGDGRNATAALDLSGDSNEGEAAEYGSAGVAQARLVSGWDD